MKNEIFEEAIVPNELIVGITGNLCYVTYMEGKKMNSEKSWTNWSQNSTKPLIIKNEFSTGFKLGGVNGRWSRQASNADNLLIEHPLFKKCFEISLDRFIQIAKRCTIVNGVIDAELIMDKGRNIIFRDEYDKLVLAHSKKLVEQQKIKEKNSANKVKSADQVPGKFYVDAKSNNEYVYLGTATVDSNIKHVYIEASSVKSVHKTEEIKVRRNVGTTWTYDRVHSIKYPSICYVSGSSYDENELAKKRATVNDYEDMYYYSEGGYNLRVVSSKISMAESVVKKNIFDSYTEDDWKIVNRCFNKDYTEDNKRRGWNDEILKGSKAENHFRKDYEQKIAKG